MKAMIDEKIIRDLVETKLSETSLFVTDLVVKQGNLIQIFIDGDQEVSIDDCVALSRHIESNLNRDEEDFTLQVSSAGVDQPLKSLRQYKKNIGRRLGIDLNDGTKISGKLLDAGVEKIQIETEIKKGHKILPGNTLEIDYQDITKAFCLVSFK
jgi:ribosome maturation factor RimP